MAATAGQGLKNARFMDLSSSKPSISGRRSVNISIKRYIISCSLSMNGCQGDPRSPIGTIETRTFPAVSTPALAMERLNLAIADMQSEPSVFDSGIIRLEVVKMGMDESNMCVSIVIEKLQKQFTS